MQPSTQGKATDREVEHLNKISKELLKCDVQIVGYAFEGDNTYNEFHKNFFESYDKKIQDDDNFNNFSMIDSLAIISDPLHVLKRSCYRLFQGNIHTSFDRNSNIL